MASELFISMNFRDVDAATASVPVLDHGFLFGDSVYEVVRTWKGRLLFADEHLARLKNSAKGIGLKLPHTRAEYKNEFRRMHKRSGNADSYLRLIVTRGTGALELATKTCADQLSIVIAKALTVWDKTLYERGAKLSIPSVLRNSPRATNPAFKTGNYLNNVLAIEQVVKAGATEALMLNSEGFVTECTTANVFWIKDDKIFTPALDAGILAGVTRAKVIGLCKTLGLDCEEGRYLPNALLSADEAFITSTTRDVMPVTRVDNATIARGKPGPLTAKLMKSFHDLCEREAEPAA